MKWLDQIICVSPVQCFQSLLKYCWNESSCMRNDFILYCACEGCRDFDKTTPFQSQTKYQTNLKLLMLKKNLSTFPSSIKSPFRIFVQPPNCISLPFTIVFFLFVTIVFFPIQARRRLRIQGAVKLWAGKWSY